MKPSNVLLAEGDRVSVRLLDFGLARMAEAETLTAQGDVPGTLAYISPERLAGEDATEAADVWAVGVMLWESLAGRHPFWQTSMLETARAIETRRSVARDAPPRPAEAARAARRPVAVPRTRPPPVCSELAGSLRGAAAPPAAQAGSRVRARPSPPRPAAPAPAVLAGVFAAWTALSLPFYPHRWTVGLAVAAAAVTALRPRAGLAVALAVPVLPLGNISLGLAVLYACIAIAWLVLSWREPRGGLLFALGPLLAPLGALGLVPLATATLRAGPRRAAQAGAAVGVAAIVAGVRHASLPLIGARAPLGLGIAGARDPLDVAGSLARAAGAHPGLVIEAAVFAAVALALPYAHARGRWGAAVLGAAMLAATVLAVPSAPAVPLAAASWLTAAAVALESTPGIRRTRRG